MLGSTIHQYKVIAQLGGMGVVDPGEAQAVVRLNHTKIVPFLS